MVFIRLDSNLVPVLSLELLRTISERTEASVACLVPADSKKECKWAWLAVHGEIAVSAM